MTSSENFTRPDTDGRKGSTLSRISTLHSSRAPFAWLADGTALVTSYGDNCIAIWDAKSHQIRKRIETPTSPTAISISKTHIAAVVVDHVFIWTLDGQLATTWLIAADEISWSPDGRFLAATDEDGTTIHVRNADTGKTRGFIRHSEYPDNVMIGMEWSPDSRFIYVSSYDLDFLDVDTGEWSSIKFGIGLYDVSCHPNTAVPIVAAASAESTVEVWHAISGAKLVVLEGHTGHVRNVAFTSNGSLLISASDKEVIVWRCSDWIPIGSTKRKDKTLISPRPNSTHFALGGEDAPIQIWSLDEERALAAKGSTDVVTYKTAKIVLVGDSGVGKTGLGWRLAHNNFKEHSSTHGQQFWILDSISTKSGTIEQEVILWDLAGQPDYRLIHALFLDDADAALVVFDPTQPDNPFRSPDYWVRQLKLCDATGSHSQAGPPSILVAARIDRGTARMTAEEIHGYCTHNGLRAYVPTSARTGEGLDELIEWLSRTINWSAKPATVTTTTFKVVKEHVLSLKENRAAAPKLLTYKSLYANLPSSLPKEGVDEDKIQAAVGHLANHGFVTVLKTAKGELRLLLHPELINNLAASFVLEARRNARGLGALSESELISGQYNFSELGEFSEIDSAILIDATITMFLKHNICFRETDPLNGKSYLIFPELINQKRPDIQEKEPLLDDTSYTISGAVENVYASLVVLLGYTSTFTRTNQWRNQARYEVGNGSVCGFRLDDTERDPTLILYFGASVSESVKSLFKSLFESFLSKHDISVVKIDTVTCSLGHTINRNVVRESLSAGRPALFCNQCGNKVVLTSAGRSHLNADHEKRVETERRQAERRSKLEQALFRISAYATDGGKPKPTCFISYAWGNPDHEEWVEKNLASDLAKAGLNVTLDRWDNSQIGASVPRFVSTAADADIIVVVGTPEYNRKFANVKSGKGFIAAAEGDLVMVRMTGSEDTKCTVLPLVLDGTPEEALPSLLHGRVFSDFREEERYATEMLALALSAHRIPARHSLSVELRKELTNLFR